MEGENVESQNIKVELQHKHKLVVKFLAIKITKIAEDEAEDSVVIVK